jgi:hypothetical protein
LNAVPTFRDLSTQAAKSFLLTAVVFDDVVTIETTAQPAARLAEPPEVWEGIVEDVPSLREEVTGPDTVELGPAKAAAAANADGDAKTTPLARMSSLTAGFSEQGIICAVLIPQADASEPSTDPAQIGLIATARRADLLVLDWHLGIDRGHRTLAIIHEIVERDRESGRTRLIAIYTDEPALDVVEKMLLDGLADRVPLTRVSDGVLTSPQLHIVVLGKAGGIAVPHEYEGCVVDDNQVASRLIQEFTAMHAGLLGNLAMAALGQLRERTHPLLARFDSAMDAAVAADRSMRAHPAEAEELALSLVLQDLQSALDVVQLRHYVNLTAITAWLDTEKHSDGFWFPSTQDGVKLTREFVVDLLQSGKAHIEPPPNVRGWSRHKNDKSLTCIFAHHADTAALDSQFAQLTHVQTSLRTRRNADPPPVLHLGTIVSRPIQMLTTAAAPDKVDAPQPANPSESRAYLICVQPECDSIRVTPARPFLFLPLSVRMTGETPHYFDIALEEPGVEILHLEVARQSFALIGIPFNPTREGVVEARRDTSDAERWLFPSADDGPINYQWVADLRPFQAQRILQEFSATLARIGIDEGEWGRTHRRRP